MYYRFLFLPILAVMMSCQAPPRKSDSDPVSGRYAQPVVDYEALRAGIATERDSMARLYASANAAAQARLVKEARASIVGHLVNDLFPQWYGTQWDFNGVTQKPREGAIACGYFVSTLLLHTGFKVERIRMAQQASSYIIRSLSPKVDRHYWSGIAPAEVARRLEKLPEGLYVVGLDIHTGFLLHDAKGTWFIHASYGNPAVVVRESVADSAILAQSKVYIVGRVDNDWLLKKWLNREKIKTVTS